MNAEIRLKIVAGLVASLILLALCYAAYLSGPIGRRNAVFFFGVLAIMVFLDWRKARRRKRDSCINCERDAQFCWVCCDSITAASQGGPLWLWRDGDDFIAFTHEFPCYPNGDPMTLGEPAARARFVLSHPHKPRADGVPEICRKLVVGFMLDCNVIGLHGAAENLHKGIKERAAALSANEVSRG